MKNIIKIDENTCIGCGLCSQDCPSDNIIVKDKKADILSQNCLKCGHCTAICPENSVSISGYREKPIEKTNIEKLNPKTLMDALIFRRSIRKFKDKKIDDYIIQDIIQAGRWTPTAKNNQDVSYIVINEKKDIVEKEGVKIFKKLISYGKIFNKSLRGIEIDENFFFKKAPIAILISSDNKVNGSLAASNMALMAESHGLGVLYSGFFTVATNKSKKIRKYLNLEKKNAVTTLVLGYPDVKYLRSTQKIDAKVQYK